MTTLPAEVSAAQRELDRALKTLIRDLERIQLADPDVIACELAAWSRNDGEAQSIRTRLLEIRALAALEARQRHPEWHADRLAEKVGASSRSHAFKLVATGRDLLAERMRDGDPANS